MRMAFGDRRIGRCKHLPEDSIPALDHALALASTVPEEIVDVLWWYDIERIDDHGGQGTVDWRSCLLRIEEQFVIGQACALQARSILNPKARVLQEQHHRADLRTIATLRSERLGRAKDTRDLLVVERKRLPRR